MGGNRTKRYDPKRHHRRSIRLKGYDYTQPGAYFVTTCTHNREPLFGRVVDGEMVLNALGEIVWACWREIPIHFPHVELDAFVVMPNHVHGIIWIVDDVGATHAQNVGRRMRRPYRARVGPHRDHWGPLWVPSNPRPPAASTNCAAHRAHGYGNAIIGNTSSATTVHWMPFVVT